MRLKRTLALAVLFTVSIADAGEREDAKLGIEGVMPSLAGETEWVNSPPLTPLSLRGKVVLVNFWTYSCINSLRPMPYLRAWAAKYSSSGLVVIGVHSPEFQFEKNSANVHRALKDHHLTFPVAVDSDYTVWKAFHNEYWPALYFIDTKGRVRYHQFGEGQYERLEGVIKQLLAEGGSTAIPVGYVSPKGEGVEAAPGLTPAQSKETYLGYDNARGFASPGGAVRDETHSYLAAPLNRADQWALTGDWSVER